MPGHTPAEFAEGRWSLTLAVQPTSSSSTFRSTDTQEMETVTTTAAISERRKESGMETDMIEIISSKQDIKANEGHNMEILEGESENDDGNDEEIMFWQGQR